MFPFDSHTCDVTVRSAASIKLLELLKPFVSYKKSASKEDSIQIKSEKVPFEMEAKSISPYIIELDNGYNYSYAGVRIYFKRNSFGLLVSRFYAPTATFSALSILSYNIDIDKVLYFKVS